MILNPVHRLLELKELRRRRTEDALRRRHSALDNAVAVVQNALTDLHRWREHRLSREAALYDPLIGKAAALIDLEEVKAKMISMRGHEQLLQNRLEEARAEADRARRAHDEAYHLAREAWREVTKFEDLVGVLRSDAQRKKERSADLELEDFAQARNSFGRENDNLVFRIFFSDTIMR
ncbi:type III secretion system stalk subunit SctO [Rhizobium gallicum]|uniref:type III secretion system stalk subunit SctO n=1 Tax=Rhizobium gallicum TaxID=56730 RepID=UPI001EF78D92|nr:YscO family type III secretion system apparatus protein [Rhizobium gallicum]ULJ74445.1 type III secretion protein [Rhizobium gallicum]